MRTTGADELSPFRYFAVSTALINRMVSCCVIRTQFAKRKCFYFFRQCSTIKQEITHKIREYGSVHDRKQMPKRP